MALSKKLFLMLVLVVSFVGVQAQEESKPPFIYYYSNLLGGIIIERADGTESRQIGEDVLLPGEGGMGGAGWSPSGKYFAAHTMTTDYAGGFGTYTGRPIIMNLQGEEVGVGFHFLNSTYFMQWSPDGKDILLFVAKYTHPRSPDNGTFFWVFDVEKQQTLVEFGINVGSFTIETSAIKWDIPNEQITFGYKDSFLPRYYRVIMKFDGTTLREPTLENTLIPPFEEFFPSEQLYENYGLSPSGKYEVQGSLPTILTNTLTGEQIELPTNPRGTTCRDHRWSDDEEGILLLSSLVIAGGGCGGPGISVTDSKVSFWRGLGSCSWHPVCAGWLPQNVDVDALPPAFSLPVLIEPVRFEEDIEINEREPREGPLRLDCIDYPNANIIEVETSAILFNLKITNCLSIFGDGFNEYDTPFIIAYDESSDLLATYQGLYSSSGVSIWRERDRLYERVLQLASQGLELEFTEDGQYLRARNMKGWKVYAVEDILTRIEEGRRG